MDREKSQSNNANAQIVVWGYTLPVNLISACIDKVNILTSDCSRGRVALTYLLSLKPCCMEVIVERANWSQNVPGEEKIVKIKNKILKCK